MSKQRIIQLSPLAQNWSVEQEAQCKSDFFRYRDLTKILPWETAEMLRELSIFFELAVVISACGKDNDVYFANALQFIDLPYFLNSPFATRSMVQSACVIRLMAPNDYMPHLERLIQEFATDLFPCPKCGNTNVFISWGYYHCPGCESEIKAFIE